MDAFRIPMRGYERAPPLRMASMIRTFRIPMRGYELAATLAAGAEVAVPNPHEGL